MQVGDLINVSSYGNGTIRFIGTTQFSAGQWIGLELEQPNGKNDGSVNGVRYFECKPQHGVFLRASQLKSDPTAIDRRRTMIAPQSKPEDRRQTLIAARQAVSDRRSTLVPSQRRVSQAPQPQLQSDVQQKLMEVKRAKEAQQYQLIKNQLEETASKYQTLLAEHESTQLDKEMADEHVQLLQIEIEELRLSMQEDTEHVPGTASADQLAKALIQLRDQHSETKLELSKKIKQCEHLQVTQKLYQESLAKLKETEERLQYVKDQLDDALQSSPILDELTHDKLQLSEQVEMLQLQVDDLEAMKELNDELEFANQETIRDLSEDLKAKDSELSKIEKETAKYKDVVIEYEYLIQQFRQLTVTLQKDLQRLQSMSLNGKSAKDLESQSRSMLDLNMKLQQSSRKFTDRSMEMEKLKLELQLQSLKLQIAQSSSITDSENDGFIASYVEVNKCILLCDMLLKYSQSYGGLKALVIAVKFYLSGLMLSMQNCSVTEMSQFYPIKKELAGLENFLQSTITSVVQESISPESQLSMLRHSETIKHLFQQFGKSKFLTLVKCVTEALEFVECSLMFIEPQYQQHNILFDKSLILDIKTSRTVISEADVKLMINSQVGDSVLSLFSLLYHSMSFSLRLPAMQQSDQAELKQLLRKEFGKGQNTIKEGLGASLSKSKLLIQQVAADITKSSALLAADQITPPWILRSQLQQKEQNKTASLGEQVGLLQQKLAAVQEDIKLKEELLQRSSIKQDLLERKLQQSKHNSSSSAAMEQELHLSKSKVEVLSEAMKTLQEEYDHLESQCKELINSNNGKARQEIVYTDAQQQDYQKFLKRQVEQLKGNEIQRMYDSFLSAEWLEPKVKQDVHPKSRYIVQEATNIVKDLHMLLAQNKFADLKKQNAHQSALYTIQKRDQAVRKLLTTMK